MTITNGKRCVDLVVEVWNGNEYVDAPSSVFDDIPVYFEPLALDGWYQVRDIDFVLGALNEWEMVDPNTRYFNWEEL